MALAVAAKTGERANGLGENAPISSLEKKRADKRQKKETRRQAARCKVVGLVRLGGALPIRRRR
ncbi:MAG: hypothetical protein LH480_02635 [Rubrivivax sp.]|nr:hypothetical protein [Rubrivivax sp.]